MRFTPTDEQRALADAVRDLPSHSWDELAGVGLFGLLVPVEHGGLGLTAVDAMPVLTELGRAAVGGPIVESALIAPLLLRGQPTLLSGLAAGKTTVSVQLTPREYAAGARAADIFLLGNGDELHAVPRAEVTLTDVPGIDPGRPLARVSFTPRAATRLPDAVGAARRLGALGAAAMLLGAGRRLLHLSVEHATVRRQFGRPIGSYQAIAHQLADVLLGLEFASPLVTRAAYTLGVSPSTDRDVSAAKAVAGEAAERAARTALQVHGAIGYTAELPLRRWLTMVFALSRAHGDASFHYARITARLFGAARVP